jgi:plasmid stabilization system protein ParE
MKVVVREAAARDLEAIFEWIVKDNPRAATAMVERIGLASIGWRFKGFPTSAGGLLEGIRELVEPPYIIVYEVHDAIDEIEVLAVVYGARSREQQR